ncbi:MAG: xcpT 11 [Phycisphaerales bacterium]|nr:xcpT 11 [Phycisphaerales bacterium]
MTMTTRTRRTTRRARRSAFTLIELLLVLVILGVLAAIVVPKLAGEGEKAKVKAAGSTVHAIDGALDMFEIDNSRYPTSDEGIKALVEAPANAKNWHEYIKGGMPKDPWGQDYIYRYPGQINKNGPDVFSMGPDMKEGGTDDIGNWSATAGQ